MAFSFQKYTINSFRFTSVQDDSEVVAIACSLTGLVYRGTGWAFQDKDLAFFKCKLYCFDDWKVALLKACVEATLNLMKRRGRSEEIIKSSELHSKPEELYDAVAILDLTRGCPSSLVLNPKWRLRDKDLWKQRTRQDHRGKISCFLPSLTRLSNRNTLHMSEDASGPWSPPLHGSLVESAIMKITRNEVCVDTGKVEFDLLATTPHLVFHNKWKSSVQP